MAFCDNVDGAGESYAKCNKSYRERQIPYVFTLMWILRNLTEDHGGREGEKYSYKERGREANHKRLKYREQTEGCWGLV